MDIGQRRVKREREALERIEKAGRKGGKDSLERLAPTVRPDVPAHLVPPRATGSRGLSEASFLGSWSSFPSLEINMLLGTDPKWLFVRVSGERSAANERKEDKVQGFTFLRS